MGQCYCSFNIVNLCIKHDKPYSICFQVDLELVYVTSIDLNNYFFKELRKYVKNIYIIYLMVVL